MIKKIRFIAVVIILALLGIFILGIGVNMVLFGQNIFQVFGPSPHQVQQAGQPLVDAIHEYRNHHGSYPANLEDAGIEVLKTVYGPFEYFQHDGGGSFELTNGDYMRDGFVAVYDGDTQRWYVDH